MNKKKKYYINIVITFFVIFCLVGYVLINNNKEQVDLEEKRYYKDSFHGIVKNKRINRGIIVKLESKGKSKKYYLKSSKNFHYTPAGIFEFIHKGDSIYKEPNSMNLYIFRANEKYYFKLGEYINP